MTRRRNKNVKSNKFNCHNDHKTKSKYDVQAMSLGELNSQIDFFQSTILKRITKGTVNPVEMGNKLCTLNQMMEANFARQKDFWKAYTNLKRKQSAHQKKRFILRKKLDLTLERQQKARTNTDFWNNAQIPPKEIFVSEPSERAFSTTELEQKIPPEAKTNEETEENDFDFKSFNVGEFFNQAQNETLEETKDQASSEDSNEFNNAEPKPTREKEANISEHKTLFVPEPDKDVRKLPVVSFSETTESNHSLTLKSNVRNGLKSDSQIEESATVKSRNIWDTSILT